MAEQNNPDFNIFDFMVSEDGEVMLMLYARQTPPSENPTVKFNQYEQTVELTRNPDVILNLENIEENILQNLQNAENLLVCELNPNSTDDESEIVYAYEAKIIP